MSKTLRLVVTIKKSPISYILPEKMKQNLVLAVASNEVLETQFLLLSREAAAFPQLTSACKMK